MERTTGHALKARMGGETVVCLRSSLNIHYCEGKESGEIGQA